MQANNPPRIALVTALAARELDEDLPPLYNALAATGAAVHIAAWDDHAIDWSSFDLALLRSTWDYTTRIEEFRDWCARVAVVTTLRNPLSVIQWNLDKHYLAELAAASLPTVPSAFVEPGESADAAIAAFLVAHADAAEIVIKPAIGAGSRDTERHARGALPVMRAHVQRLLDAGRSALLQPYLDRVDVAGETALVFFAGQFSHAIRKGPLLRAGAAATSALFAPEEITPRTPGEDEHRLASRVLAAIPGGVPLYARVDLIRDSAGAPCVLELEMAEPSLFFAHAPGSAERFAQAILATLR